MAFPPRLTPILGSEYWITEHFHNGPTPPGQPGGHRRRGAAVLKRTLSAFPWDRFGELDAQALMVACEVVVSSPPLEVLAEFGGILSRSPGATGQLRDTFPDGEVGALNVGRIDISAEPSCFEEGTIYFLRTPNETLFDVNNTGSMPMFDDLGIVEGGGNHPGPLLLSFDFYPFTEMSGERVEVML